MAADRAGDHLAVTRARQVILLLGTTSAEQHQPRIPLALPKGMTPSPTWCAPTPTWCLPLC